MNRHSFQCAAERVMARCDQLAQCTERSGEITRTYCSNAMRDAHRLVAEWMQQAGMTTTVDPAANLRGWYPPAEGRQDGRRLLLGSHLDTVIKAGRYDGVLGVLMGLAVVELAHAAARRWPVAMEVIAFADEEGVRFQSPYLGSRAVAGDFPTSLLGRRDSSGQTLHDVLRAFGGNPDALHQATVDPSQVVAYLEPHIEQGPVLEQRDLPVATVTGIVGQSRGSLSFVGHAGHAGTVPMFARRDALAAAAETVLHVEQLARQTDGLVGTVGQLHVEPNAGNVIPGKVTLRVELRHAVDQVREEAFEAVCRHARQVAERRGMQVHLELAENQPAVPCDPHVLEVMDEAMRECGLPPLRLASGAGHDAAALAGKMPIGLLFVRCQAGISHHPAEAVRPADVATGIEVLWRTVDRLAAERFE